jgi:hypothetical protein
MALSSQDLVSAPAMFPLIGISDTNHRTVMGITGARWGAPVEPNRSVAKP